MIPKNRQEVLIYWSIYKPRIIVTFLFVICSLAFMTSYYETRQKYIKGLVIGKDYLADNFGNVDMLIVSTDDYIARLPVADNSLFSEGAYVCLAVYERAFRFSKRLEVTDIKNCLKLESNQS